MGRVDPASYEARQLARLIVIGVPHRFLARSNDASQGVFAVAAAAAEVDDYQTAVVLGHGATRIRQGGRASQAWLAAIEYWRTQLGTDTPPDDPETASIRAISQGLGYLATIASHTDEQRAGQVITQLGAAFSEASRYAVDDTIDHLRLEFAARAVEHGHGPLAAAHLDEIIGHHTAKIELRAAIDSGWVGSLRLAQRLEPQIETLTQTRPGTLDLANAHRALGDLWNTLGDYPRALHHYQQRHPILTTHLGPDHPDTLTTRNNIAAWTGEAGDAAGALPLFERAPPRPGAGPGPRPPRHPDHPQQHRLLDRGDRGCGRGAAPVRASSSPTGSGSSAPTTPTP